MYTRLVMLVLSSNSIDMMMVTDTHHLYNVVSVCRLHINMSNPCFFDHVNTTSARAE